MQSVVYLRPGTQRTQDIGVMSTGCLIVSALAMLIICNNTVMSKDKVKAKGLKESTQHT